MLVSLQGTGPLYQRIYRSLRDLILAGHFPPGARLPVTRDLATELNVSRNVVLLAYAELVAEGYAAGRVGSGTYVSHALPDVTMRAPSRTDGQPPRRKPPSTISRYARRLLALAPAAEAGPSPKLRYDFFYGRVSTEDFPERLWRKIATRRLSTPLLGYIAPEGDARLRAGIAAYLRANRGVECEPEQILVVNGTLQALDLTTRLLLDPGDAVAIEDPHYPDVREILTAAGMRVRAIPVDAGGMRVDRLPREPGRLRSVHVTPSHQFPSGAILPLQRRLALLSWAARTGAYVVEDDYDSEFRYDARPIEALQGIDRGQRVIYMGTFSRSLFPALRLGYLVAPGPLVPMFVQAKRLADRHSAPWAQQVLADFIHDGHLDRHLRRCRARKAALRAALLESIQRRFGTAAEVRGAASGVHVLLRLPSFPYDRLEWLRTSAARKGVGIYAAAPYYLKPPGVSELVMGYGAMREEEIHEGVRILASLF